jgi:chromosomal replication initiation ATPase DnaA
MARPLRLEYEGAFYHITSRVYGCLIIGRAEFIKEALKKLKEGYEGKAEISHRRSLRTAGSADEIVTLVARSNQATDNDVKAKKIAIYLLKKYTGMTNGEIGKQFGGLSYSAVAKAFSRLEERMKRDGKLRTVIKNIEKQMSNVKG